MEPDAQHAYEGLIGVIKYLFIKDVFPHVSILNHKYIPSLASAHEAAFGCFSKVHCADMHLAEASQKSCTFDPDKTKSSTVYLNGEISKLLRFYILLLR